MEDIVLEITESAAWEGGRIMDNSHFEFQGMTFKGGIPVTDATIQERIGVKTRRVASPDERIAVSAFEELLKIPGYDPSRIKVLVCATNFGDDKHDLKPQVGPAYELIRRHCPNALVFDLYAGCPGFNAAVEQIFMLSLSGCLGPGDLSVIIGAENIAKAQGFPELDTSNIIFGDDALASYLETRADRAPQGRYRVREGGPVNPAGDRITDLARAVAELLGEERLDGLIVDNQQAGLDFRIPACAARVQHRFMELQYPEAAGNGTFDKFKDAYAFYRERMNAFAFDIQSLDGSPETVNTLAAAAVRSGKYASVVSVFFQDEQHFELALHQGEGYVFKSPQAGVVDAITRTHGCFGDYIQGVRTNGDVFCEMDGKGVFLYGTRSAPVQLSELLGRNGLTLTDIDLLIEHQANFAMVLLTMEQLLKQSAPNIKQSVAEFVSRKMVNNIHERGNCSVACMQRLPFDLDRGALEPDAIQGISVNQNLEALQQARTICYDSVGAGMTRSSFLYRKPDSGG